MDAEGAAAVAVVADGVSTAVRVAPADANGPDADLTGACSG
jgi:hypothetical protein